MSDIELFSMPLCPFAHRVRLVLAEKAIVYRLTEIDLSNKPQAFLKVSTYGKVPALRHGDTDICESTIINEYLDEAFPDPPLLPHDPARRARARFWIEFANSRLFAVTASLLYGPHRQNRSPAIEQIAAALRFMETEALAKRPADGPYWLGSEISLVDLTFYPWFEQLPVLAQLCSVHMPPDLDGLAAWREAVAQRSAVRAIAKPPQFYLEHYPRHGEEVAA
jgi:glutathione S-transferase